MSLPVSCPRCRIPADPIDLAADSGSRSCPQCGGVFVPGAEVQAEFLLLDAPTADEPPIACLGCDNQMQSIRLDDVVIDHCRSCGGVWLDAGETLDVSKAGFSPGRLLLYGLSLPERVLRSGVGVAAGAVFEAASLIVPQAFQSATTYQLVVHNSLKFLTSDIGGVTRTGDDAAVPAADDYVARKAVGNFIDLAGMATLHVSPLWLLAIVSDVAYGTKTYALELAAELEKQGLIDETSTIHNVDDILDALQNASGRAASLFDTPPLSVDELRRTLNETRASITAADYRTILPEAEVQKFWAEMRGVAQTENVSLLGVSAALTMNTLSKVTTVTRGALTGVEVVGGLFNRHVIGHYAATLRTIEQQGLFPLLRETSAPYVAAVWNNFSDRRSTWTEELFSGRAIQSGLKSISRWFCRQQRETPSDES